MGTVPGPVGHLSFNDILDTSLKVSWQEPGEKNGILTGRLDEAPEPKGGSHGGWGNQLVCPLPTASSHPDLPTEPNSQILVLHFQSTEHLRAPAPTSAEPQGFENLKGLSQYVVLFACNPCP